MCQFITVEVNKLYKGAVSYGTISQEEMEEAARIRDGHSPELSQELFDASLHFFAR